MRSKGVIVTVYMIDVYTVNATPMTPERGGFRDVSFDGWE